MMKKVGGGIARVVRDPCDTHHTRDPHDTSLEPGTSKPATNPVRSLLLRTAFLFITLFILTVPFPKEYLPDPAGLIEPLVSEMAGAIATGILGVGVYSRGIHSDSLELSIHSALLLPLSIALALLWLRLGRLPQDDRRIGYWTRTIAAYDLALHLLIYGVNKVVKLQFFLPEPNTLFTPVGALTRDILYWTAIGASREWSMFAGGIEVVAALLLLFRRTRLPGALIAFGIMVNVLAVNIGFDISVKLFAAFLLLLSVVVIAGDAERLRRFFGGKSLPEAGSDGRPAYRSTRSHAIYVAIKGAIVCAFLFEAIATAVATGNLNDDTSPRPPYHGAWEVTRFSRNGIDLPPLTTDTTRWRRFFIHRRGYFITQRMDDAMRDYYLRSDSTRIVFLLEDVATGRRLSFTHSSSDDSTMTINGLLGLDTIIIDARRVDLEDLPLLRDDRVHWRMDHSESEEN